MSEGTRGDWISKQHQRVDESWKIHAPIIALANLVMLLATLATLSWGVQIGFLIVGLLMFGLLGYLWLSGYIMDKTKYLQRRSSRLLQMTQTIPMYHQYSLAGAVTVQMIAEVLAVALPGFNPEALEVAKELVERELLWFKAYSTGEIDLTNNREEPKNE